jgi:putative transposase
LGCNEKDKIHREPIIGILKEQETGKKVAEICRALGISQPAFYGWKSKYSGLEVNQVKRMKELGSELSQYKKIVAEQTLHITVLKDVIEKKL